LGCLSNNIQHIFSVVCSFISIFVDSAKRNSYFAGFSVRLSSSSSSDEDEVIGHHINTSNGTGSYTTIYNPQYLYQNGKQAVVLLLYAGPILAPKR